MTAPDLISSDGTASQEWSLARPDARRSLILCATGAILGLAIAGFGLFTAEGTRTANVPAEDAAVVDQIPILRSDFLQQLRALHDVDLSRATPAQKKQVLDDMIREELYVQRGVELGMANDDVDVRTALVAATEGQTALDATTAGATDEELRTYFNAHRGAYAGEGTMELADWLVPIGQESRALATATALQGGATPQSQSLVTSGKVDDGQEYYFAARIHLGPALFDAAVPLKDGGVSAPLTVAGRTHILVMKHNRPPPPVVFDNVRDQVFGNFVRDKIARLEQGNARFLRKRADIKIAPDLQ